MKKNYRSLFTLLSCALLFACSENNQNIGNSINQDRPNILLVVADDLGYTDLGSFGSEIPTPNLDALAFDGVRLTNFHGGRACQQTRAMLMSGRGVSSVMESRPTRPDGQRDNIIRTNVALVSELLQDAGYTNFISGKWDLGLEAPHTPTSRGFDRGFVLLEAANRHFNVGESLWNPLDPDGEKSPSYYEEDGNPLEFSDLPDDFYSTKNYTDKILDYLKIHDGESPWFAFMPLTAPHWPLQVPDDWLNRHEGKYDQGYDTLREERINQASLLGVIPNGANLDNNYKRSLPWISLSSEQKIRYARSQEIYASMIEYMDMSIGRVIEYLKSSNQFENTVIIFLSDHGASSGEHGANPNWQEIQSGPKYDLNRFDNSLENYGKKYSWIDHGEGFAEAASAPFKYFKGRISEGGLRGAGFIFFPKAINQPSIDHTFLTYMDLFPTLLDIAETNHPGAGNYKGREILPIIGKSFWPYLLKETDQVHGEEDVAGWSANSTGAIVRGNYKLINHPPPGLGGGETVVGFGDSGVSDDTPWELYDLSIDPSETNNIASDHPELVSELAEIWERDWR
tara:strand:+ start:1561 stop:3264 length:1704 start_codon:yes stop_codon:yes gene_type:complete